jgi:hypothetical protein
VNVFSDAHTALLVVAKMAALGLLICSLEYLRRPHTLGDAGLMSWPVTRLRHRRLASGPLGASLDVAVRYPSVLGVLAVRAALAAAVLLLPGPLAVSPALTIPLALTTLLILLHSSYGLDGADQMLWILVGGLALVTLSNAADASRIYLWFVALQACLSYFVAGVAKLTARGWRDGSFLVAIAQTSMYGHQRISQFLAARQPTATTISWLIILWESMFPVVLVVPEPIAAVLLCVGIVFHFVNAVVMGLNTFFVAFVATYPAIAFCVESRGF